MTAVFDSIATYLSKSAVAAQPFRIGRLYYAFHWFFENTALGHRWNSQLKRVNT